MSHDLALKLMRTQAALGRFSAEGGQFIVPFLMSKYFTFSLSPICFLVSLASPSTQPALKVGNNQA